MSILTHLAPPIAHGRPLPVADDPLRHRAAGGRVYAVQRLGAVIVGGFLLTFGLLGLTSGVPFLSPSGQRFLGLPGNGLLSAVSVVVAAILLGAALRGPRLASTVMLAVGSLFLVSALVNLLAVGTTANVLGFEMTDVVFSVAVGLLLLVLGAYGRVSGNLPADSPYARPHPRIAEPADGPATPEEAAADVAMRLAEIAVAEHRATDAQRRRVAAMAGWRTRADRRRVWMEPDEAVAYSAPAEWSRARKD